MQPRDWLLLAIEAAGTDGLSPVQLQKALFLFGAKTKKISDQGEILSADNEFYSFRAYDYGPFARNIYCDAEVLEQDETVEIISDPSCARRYRITAQGTNGVAGLKANCSQTEIEYLGRLVVWVKSLSFDTLLRTVYNSFPEMAVNSVFRGGR